MVSILFRQEENASEYPSSPRLPRQGSGKISVLHLLCESATPKKVKSPAGSFELQTPRDRAGTFEPQLVKKHQTHLTDELERKVLALYALGTSYQDIRGHIQDLYGIELSNGTLNAVTDKLLPE